MPEERTALVYSTDRSIPRRGKPQGGSDGRPAGTTLPRRAVVRLDKKGRRGKSVTVVEGLQLSDNDKKTFLAALKTRLSTGGTINDGALELQGDHCDAVMGMIEKMGQPVTRSGR